MNWGNWARPGAGSGTNTSQVLVYDPAQRYVQMGWTPTVADGGFTTGCVFVPFAPLTITGVKIYYPGEGMAKSWRAALWDASDTSTPLATLTQSINGAGMKVFTFASPYVVPADKVGVRHYVGAQRAANDAYLSGGGGNPDGATGVHSNAGQWAGKWVYLVATRAYGNNYSAPTNIEDGEIRPVSPIFEDYAP